MEEKKLTDEEIVKSLECCAVEPCEDCGNCPRFTKEKLCHKANAKQSLDLINRQKAEIERLKGFLSTFETVIAEQKEDIEKRVEVLYPDFMKEYRRAKNDLKESLDREMELQKQVDELKERLRLAYEECECEGDYDTELENLFEQCKKDREQAVKDTAKEILIAVQKKITHLRANGHLGREQDIRLSRFLVGKAQDYGVEVE